MFAIESRAAMDVGGAAEQEFDPNGAGCRVLEAEVLFVAKMTPAQREVVEHAERGIEKHLAARRASAAEQPTADAADLRHDGRTD